MQHYDDRLDKTIPWGDSAYWRCKNHPKLRWFGKNMPARSRFFAGEAENETARMAVKEPSMSPDPIYVLKCRLNGVNPYDNSIKDENPITSIEQVEKFLEWVKVVSQTHAFECTCPMSDMEIIPGGDKEVPL